MEVILMCAPSFQGGHSDVGQRLAEIIDCEFPINMMSLEKRAVEMKFDPAKLWPRRKYEG